MKRFAIGFLAMLLLLAVTAERSAAQFIGYTSPQTNAQTLAKNATCQSGTFPVQNLGQTQHLATAKLSTNVQIFSMQFFGVDQQGNAFPISDIATVSPNPFASNGVLQAVGYFPVVQIQVTCFPNTETFTLDYAGSSSSPIFSQGGYATAQYDKAIFNNAIQSVASAQIVSTSPTLNASGEVIFSYFNAPSGTKGTLTVACNSVANSGLPFAGGVGFLRFNLQNNTSAQVFPIPALPCPSIVVSYTPPGTPASPGFYSVEYLFFPPGLPIAADYCASPGIPKQSVPINITSATTTQLIPPAFDTAIYVCGLNVSTVGGSFQLEDGTGGTCGTGTQVLTGAYPAGTISYGPGSEIFAPTPLGAGLCVISGAGLSNAQGVLTFVQQ